MKNEFIKYNQALEIKELGFNETCFGKYHGDEIIVELTKHSVLSAPLLQQCVLFLLHLMDNNDTHISYSIEYYSDYSGRIIQYNMGGVPNKYTSHFLTSDELINQLIKINKRQNNMITNEKFKELRDTKIDSLISKLVELKESQTRDKEEFLTGVEMIFESIREEEIYYRYKQLLND